MLETKRGVGFARECIGGPWNSRQITKGDKYKVQFSPFSIQKSTFNFSLAPFFFLSKGQFCDLGTYFFNTVFFLEAGFHVLFPCCSDNAKHSVLLKGNNR